MHRYRIGMVGAGNVTKMHLNAYNNHKDRVEVVAICDPNEGSLCERADQYGIDERYSDVNEMIEGSEFDIAVVCSATTERKRVLFPLLEAGKAILCEKPLSESYAEALEIAEKSHAQGAKISVNQNHRFSSPVELLKNMVQDNAIGNVVNIVAFDIFFRQDTGWRVGSERHCLSVQGIHWLDAFRFILGCEATHVTCVLSKNVSVDCRGETDANVQIVFENDTIVTFTQSFSTPLGFRKNEVIVVGETGVLDADWNSVRLYRNYKRRHGARRPTRVWKNSYDLTEGTFRNLHFLIDWIENGSEAPTSVWDNIGSVRVLQAAYDSAKQQKTIAIETKYPRMA